MCVSVPNGNNLVVLQGASTIDVAMGCMGRVGKVQGPRVPSYATADQHVTRPNNVTD